MSKATESSQRGYDEKGTVLLIGGTGYVGETMRERIRDAGYRLRLMTRSETERRQIEEEGFQGVLGDVLDTNSVVRALEGADAVINLVAIIKEKGEVTFERVNYQGSVNVADAAREAGVRRLIQMSAIGAGNRPDFPYHYTKWRAENYIKDLDLDWTIFRPSLVFGPSKSHQQHFFSQLGDVVRQAPMIPVIGDGSSLFQPIHLHDVGDAFVRALDDPETAGHTYEIAGPDRFSYVEILDEVARALGRRKPKVKIPVPLMNVAATVMEAAPLVPEPVTTEQIKMLKIDNVTDQNAAPDLVGRDLIPLPGNLDYLREY